MNKLVSTVDDKLLLNPSNGKLLCVASTEPVWPFDIDSAHVLFMEEEIQSHYAYQSEYYNAYENGNISSPTASFGKAVTRVFSDTLAGPYGLLNRGNSPYLPVSIFPEDSSRTLYVDEHMIRFETLGYQVTELRPLGGNIVQRSTTADGQVNVSTGTIMQDPYAGSYRWTDPQNNEYFFSLGYDNESLRKGTNSYSLKNTSTRNEYTFTSGGQTCRLIINSLDQVSILAGMSEIPLVRYN